MLRESHSTYLANMDSLEQTATTRGAPKKADLLAFWAALQITNPLLSAVRNLTHISLVLGLYLLVSVRIRK